MGVKYGATSNTRTKTTSATTASLRKTRAATVRERAVQRGRHVRAAARTRVEKAEDKEVGRVALEATHFAVTLKGEAKKPGAPLLWVSAGALSGTTPVKRTRPFNIG